MRLFVAIDLGEEIASAAGALVERLRRRATKLAPHARVTWIPPERMHLTLRFIGHAGDESYRAILAALEPRLAIARFELAVAGSGTFPASGPPSAVWAGISEGRDALHALEREVTRRLEQAGVPPDRRAYRPHLTLARIREAAGLRSTALLESDRDVELGSTRVEGITLFESRLSPKGPTYVPLQRTRLAR